MPLSESKLEQLYDKQCLHENLMLYCRAADRFDIEGIRSTYWPDSTDDHGAYIGSGPGWADAVGADSMQGWSYSVNHHVSNVLSEIDGNRAKRESMFICVMLVVEPEMTHFLGGRYRDLCEKRGDEWKVLRRTCIWDWCDSRKTTRDYDVTKIPQMAHWGARYPEDPIYKDWFASPPTARPPFRDKL